MAGLIANDYLSGRRFPVTAAVRYVGVALKLASTGKVSIVDDSTNVVDFFSKTTSDNKIGTTIYNRDVATANTEDIACAPLTRGMVYNLYLSATNAAIDIGDEITVQHGASGRVDKKTAGAGTGTFVIGKALQAKAALDGAKTDGTEYIKVLIGTRVV